MIVNVTRDLPSVHSVVHDFAVWVAPSNKNISMNTLGVTDGLKCHNYVPLRCQSNSRVVNSLNIGGGQAGVADTFSEGCVWSVD